MTYNTMLGAEQREEQDKKTDNVATSLLNTFNSQLGAQTGLPVAYSYREFTLYCNTRVMPFYAPHLQVYWSNTACHESQKKAGSSTVEAILAPDPRGIIDALSLRLLYSDLSLHQSRKPATQIAALVYEMLEQSRVESLIPTQWPGMRLNVDSLFTHWSQSFYYSGLTNTGVGILLYTLAQVCRARLMAQAVLAETESLIEHTRLALATSIGTQLSGLRQCRHNQSKYGDYVLEIASIIEAMIEVESRELTADEQRESHDKVVKGFTILLEVDSHESAVLPTANTGTSGVLVAASQVYKVFTTQFDKMIFPVNLVRTELLQEYRHQLDKLVLQQKTNINRLARQISIKLSRPELDGWQSSKDDGYVDGGRLPLLISSPSEKDIFYQVDVKPNIHCHVSFLVDCSGSMKARIRQVATVLDILVRAFDMAGTTTEVLGFTTGAWNGGLALKQWRRQACPPNPGRLNPVWHLIFKHSKQSWRRARLGLASMLKLDLFREGIDGEAVHWACQRLLTQESTRKILVVISDGCPMDTATNQTNDRFYLDNHLKAVVAEQQKSGVEIVGLGVGIDLSPYYPNNLGIDLTRDLYVSMFDEVIEMITKLKKRP